MSEQALLHEIEIAIKLYEEAMGGFATRTRQMIEREGVISALSKLAISADLQQGFKVLRDSGKLNLTFEALIVKYPTFFLGEVVDAAKWRLKNADQLL